MKLKLHIFFKTHLNKILHLFLGVGIGSIAYPFTYESQSVLVGYLWCILMAFGIGMAIEYIQSKIPKVKGDMKDVIVTVLGGVLGAIILLPNFWAWITIGVVCLIWLYKNKSIFKIL